MYTTDKKEQCEAIKNGFCTQKQANVASCYIERSSLRAKFYKIKKKKRTPYHNMTNCDKGWGTRISVISCAAYFIRELTNRRLLHDAVGSRHSPESLSCRNLNL